MIDTRTIALQHYKLKNCVLEISVDFDEDTRVFWAIVKEGKSEIRRFERFGCVSPSILTIPVPFEQLQKKNIWDPS